jgi:hypothetical protein
MNVVGFSFLATEGWKLSREFDNLRFDILSARAVADRLRQRDAAAFLAKTASAEDIRNTLEHLESVLAFVAEVNRRMRQEPPAPPIVPPVE